MTFSLRLTEFSAAIPGDREKLVQYVRDGQAALLVSPHCIRCETYYDADDRRKVVALETWTNQEARTEAAKAIPEAAVRGAMSLMDSIPTSRNLTGPMTTIEARLQSPRLPIRVAVIIASVREERFAPIVARWFVPILSRDERYVVDIIDLADVDLPRALPADPADLAVNEKRPAQLQATSATLGSADAIIVITPEYNHGLPASLKHFIDWHFIEWRDKPVAAVGYGGLGGGIRAIENLRLVMAELNATVIRDTITFNGPWELFAEDGTLKDPAQATRAAAVLFDRLAWWAFTLRQGRTAADYTIASQS